jgi:hypothetical protein
MAAAQYMTDIPRVAHSDVCPVGQSSYTLEELNTLYPNGLVDDSLVPNPETGRIDPEMLVGRVRALENLQTTKLKQRPVKTVGSEENRRTETNMDSLIQNDAELYKSANDEYCYYEQRYRYALKRFLELATSRVQADNAEARSMLTITIKLNQRLNAIIEMMNYLAQQRVDIANQNKDDINSRNAMINKRLTQLQKVSSKLKNDTVMIQTQKEMMRYTEEKNNHVTNQISVWVALNVLALATVFYVYRA